MTVSVAIAPLDACVDRPALPYPGLRPFKPDEWSIFCGREISVREVGYMLGDHGVVFVHGGSGCGKSSLIAAGVLPKLERDVTLARKRMVHATIRPSHGPLSALAAALADCLGAPPVADGDAGSTALRGPAAAWTTALLFDRDIGALVERSVDANGLELFCLVVDQFEEIFAWARERRSSDVEALVAFLAAVRRAQSRRFAVIVTMRSDFLSDCARFPELSEVINACQYYVPNLDERGLERAIREPAAMYGGEVTQALVVRLMTEATGNVDALPVLQHALMRMAERKYPAAAGGWSLGLDDYDAVTSDRHRATPLPVGQRDNALTVHAEDIRATLVDTLGPRAGPVVETVFRALFVVDGTGHVVRNPTSLRMLEAIAGPDRDLVAAVVEAYRRDPNNLLVVGPPDAAGDRMVDISHEALLRNWRRMTEGEGGKGWIQQEKEDALAWRSLADFAQDPKARLDRVTLTRRRPLFKKFKDAPEGVRRHLLNTEKLSSVEGEHEWQSVVWLIAKSEGEVRRRFAWTIVVAALLLGLTIYFVTNEVNKYNALKESNAKLRSANTESQQNNVTAAREQDVLRSDLVTVQAAPQSTAGESRLTDEQVAAFQRVAAITTGTALAAGTAYMWVGNANLTYLRDPANRRPVPIADVVAGKPYRVSRNIALRIDVPDENNRSARQVSAVRTGDTVEALAEPRLMPSGQYWLLVRPEYRTTVYIQYATGDPAALRAAFDPDRYDVPAAQQLPIAKGLNEVRYCRNTDEAAATAVSRLLSARLGRALAVQKIAGACERISRPHVVEVWIGDAPA